MTDQNESGEQFSGEVFSVGLGRPEVVGFEAASAMELAAHIDDFITDNPKINIADIHYAMVPLGSHAATWHAALVFFHHKAIESEDR